MYTGVGRQTKRDVRYGNYKIKGSAAVVDPLSPFLFFQKEKLPYNQNFNLVMRQPPCAFTPLAFTVSRFSRCLAGCVILLRRVRRRC